MPRPGACSPCVCCGGGGIATRVRGHLASPPCPCPAPSHANAVCAAPDDLTPPHPLVLRQGVDLPSEERRALVAEESRLFKERGLPRSAAVRPVGGRQGWEGGRGGGRQAAREGGREAGRA